jgi:hypothetical protein
MSEYIINTATMDIDRKHPITRCRDCEERDTDVMIDDGPDKGLCPCSSLAHGNKANLWVRPSDYCAWPKPKEGAE